MHEVLRGIGVSPGAVAGPVVRLAPPPPEPPGDGAVVDPGAEAARAGAALAGVAEFLRARGAAAGGAAAEVLEAQAAVAEDPLLREQVAALVADGRTAARAVHEGLIAHAAALREGAAHPGGRVADLDDIRNRAIALLTGARMPGLPLLRRPSVLVARDLAPADTAMLDREKVLGVVTELGGPTSHTAILAKQLGIPAVVACPGAAALDDGANVLVDGSSGEVTVDPSRAALAGIATRTAARPQRRPDAGGPGRTADGTPVALLVNVGTVADAVAAADEASEGVGLFRTEVLYLGRTSAPTVPEQVESYRAVFEAFAGRRVVIRTLDPGADKPLPFIGDAGGQNPALGLRGLRVARRRPELLTDQLAAIAEAASSGSAEVWVMAPMVSTPAEAAEFVARARAVGLSTVGAMVEVPAAALRAAQLLERCDFVSIGTNDLAQYAFAADRTTSALADLLDAWQPALLDLVAAVADAGRRTGRPVGICGEAAGDPLLALVLVGLGLRSLSMAPAFLPAVRHALGAHTIDECRDMAKVAREADDAASARENVRRLVSPELLAVPS